MKTNPVKFGTDGWRGIIGGDFTFDNVRYCAQGVADFLKESKLDGRGLIIGYDTRFASEDFGAAAAEVIAGNGIKTYLCSRATPTPVISYGVLVKKAGGAIIITASHNPAIWNGLKYKDESGSSAREELTSKIESFISRAFNKEKVERMPLDKAMGEGLVESTDLDPVYLKQVESLVDLAKIRQSGLKVVVDPMYGTGSGYLKRLLAGGAGQIIEINSERNPLFPGIQPEPIAVNLVRLSATVQAQGANVGLATDGDADRMGIVDERGTFLTQLQVFALLCLYLLEVRGERGPIVKTITNTSMVYRLGEIFNVPVYETPVGFKHVAPVMLSKKAIIGGEESGGYGFRGHVTERDGILANLYFLDLMVRTGKRPSELVEYLYSKVGPHYYRRADIHFPETQRLAIIDRIKNNQPGSIDNVPVVKVDTFDGFRFTLKDNSWLLIRFSGTEPLLRIYVETDSPDRAERLLGVGKGLAGV